MIIIEYVYKTETTEYGVSKKFQTIVIVYIMFY